MKKVLIAVVAISVLALIGWAVYSMGKSNGESTNNPAQNQSSSNSSSQSATGKVEMKTMLFTPSQISIKKGETVTWTNNDDTAHTVTIDNGDGPNSEEIKPGDTYSYTFNDSGSFQYHCKLHSAMHGTIVVS